MSNNFDDVYVILLVNLRVVIHWIIINENIEEHAIVVVTMIHGKHTA